MSKKILGISLVALLAAGVFAFYSFSNESDEVKGVPNGEVEVAEQVKTEPVALVGKDSLSALMERGENLECTISYDSGDISSGKVEGTYFTSRGRIRGDFLTPEAGAGSVSSIILRDNTLYTWTEIEGEKFGMKIDLSTLEESKSEEENLEAKEIVPLDAEVDYDCKEWENLDGSVFEPPTDVIFRDFSDIMNTGMEFGTSYGEMGAGNSCAVCNQLTGSEKAQCLTALSCQ
jgi:hypothetical protein